MEYHHRHIVVLIPMNVEFNSNPKNKANHQTGSGCGFTALVRRLKVRLSVASMLKRKTNLVFLRTQAHTHKQGKGERKGTQFEYP